MQQEKPTAYTRIANTRDEPIPVVLVENQEGTGSGSNNANIEQRITEINNGIGSDITGATMPSGGSGIRGWLSAIYLFIVSKLGWTLNNGRLPVDVASLSVTVNNAQLEISNDIGNPISVNGSVGVTNFPATQQVSGAVSISNLTNWQFLANASDLSQTYSYLDAGTSDERINTVVYYSASLNKTITETYTYAGTSGSYRICSIARG